ncbi:hypothetical protein ABZX38_09170 [Streptomyces longwoodensis]|uniref:hypothetical protein n=1 Tax=Streptomyces longwoodensis TaxID=68231 RepID=UPI0033AEF0EF
MRLVLLVGGLFALGLLFGGQAQAAESTPDTGSRAVAGPVSSGADPAEETASSAHPTAAATAAPADPAAAAATPPAGQVVRIVGEGVVRPVGHVVRSVTEGLGQVQAQVPPVSSLPSLPALPSLPSLPSLPALPSLPSLPWLPSLPTEPTVPGLPQVPGPPDGSEGSEPPVTTLPAPVDELPQQGATPVTSAPQGHAPEQGRATATTPATAPVGPRPARGTSCGPWDAPRQSTDDRSAHGVAHHGGVRPSPGAPAQHAPGGGPSDGVLGNAPAMDNGAPRHGDAHAVTPHHPVLPRLVAGGAVGAEATETRDRYRDIPVFPA